MAAETAGDVWASEFTAANLDEQTGHEWAEEFAGEGGADVVVVMAAASAVIATAGLVYSNRGELAKAYKWVLTNVLDPTSDNIAHTIYQ